MSTILEKIKQQTEENHIALEKSRLMAPIVDRELNLSSYKKILVKFYGFFHPLEIKIDAFSELRSLLPDLDSRRKSQTLKNDLLNLGFEGEIEICTKLPAIESLPAALGCLYVMEGSTLGGRMISKIISEMLSLDKESGASFFNGYGEETGNRWKIFREALLHYSKKTMEEKIIIDSANETFIKFREWVN